MTNLKQKEIVEALFHFLKIQDLIDDGYHNKELLKLIEVSNTLFEELSDDDRSPKRVIPYGGPNFIGYSFFSFRGYHPCKGYN